ncbi:hypothetical protein ACVBEQ_06995 [Nakamurella sp. GG22]
MSANPSTITMPPVSKERLRNCIASATFWASEEALLAFAHRMQRRADQLALVTAVLGAVTSLAIWTTLSGDPSWQAQLVVSVVALGTAAAAAFSRIRNYGEAAGKARELSGQYGKILGELGDAEAVQNDPQWKDAVRSRVADFESIKSRKDLLVPYPMKEQKVRNQQR